MKKFAAIFAAVILIVSVFMVSASAKLFSDSTYYQYSGNVASLPAYDNPSRAISCYKFEVLNSSGDLLFSYGFSQETLIVRAGTSSGLLVQPQFYTVVDGVLDEGIFCPVDINYAGTRFVFYSSVNASPSGFTRVVISDTAAVSSLSTGIFSVGDSLISFITSSWLTLVVLGAFLVVLCFGVVRRLVKGV